MSPLWLLSKLFISCKHAGCDVQLSLHKHILFYSKPLFASLLHFLIKYAHIYQLCWCQINFLIYFIIFACITVQTLNEYELQVCIFNAWNLELHAYIGCSYLLSTHYTYYF
jgi:hypothetical protein